MDTYILTAVYGDEDTVRSNRERIINCHLYNPIHFRGKVQTFKRSLETLLSGPLWQAGDGEDIDHRIMTTLIIAGRLISNSVALIRASNKRARHPRSRWRAPRPRTARIGDWHRGALHFEVAGNLGKGRGFYPALYPVFILGSAPGVAALTIICRCEDAYSMHWSPPCAA